MHFSLSQYTVHAKQACGFSTRKLIIMTQPESAVQSSRNALFAVGKRLSVYIPGMRLYLAQQSSLSACSALLIVGQCYLLTQIITRVFLERQAPGQVYQLLALLLLVMLGRAALPWLSNIAAGHIAVRAKSIMRERLMQHLLQADSQQEDERSGELAHVLATGVESLDAYFSQVLPQLCATLIIPIVVLIAASITDPLSGLILFITLPLLPIFMILIGKQSERATHRRWHELGQMSAHFLEVIQGSATLKLFGQSASQRQIVRRVSEQFGRVTMQVLHIAFLSALAMEMGATLSTALVAVEVGVRLLSGQMPFSLAFLALILAPEFYQPLRALGPQFHASMDSAAGASRIFSLLDKPSNATSNPEINNCIHHAKTHHTLQFKQICYTYPASDEQRPALSDISFSVQTGQTMAIVGPSGAGKSTLADLLLRFAEPQRGSICFDDVPISMQSPQQWRQHVAWQPQRPYLFNVSGAENIALAHSGTSREEIMQAAQLVGIHEMVQALPQGYDTVVGERSARLSGGQIQRLSLARAILKQAPILILDEATSALDATAESQVLHALTSLCSSRITLMITHRLHTIRQADPVLILNEGSIAAIGSHEELQHSSTLYHQLLHTSGEKMEVPA
jgi:ATP-binding cassette subfamily C protein CydD